MPSGPAQFSDPLLRSKSDLYATPRPATIALLNHEEFPDTILEPACGHGDITRPLQSYGYQVVSTDLIDYNFGIPGLDYRYEFITGCKGMITNPPFTFCYEFILKTHQRRFLKSALLFPLRYLETLRRAELYRLSGLTRVLVFTDRVPFIIYGKPMGMVEYAWFVWERGYVGLPQVDWITWH